MCRRKNSSARRCENAKVDDDDCENTAPLTVYCPCWCCVGPDCC